MFILAVLEDALFMKVVMFLDEKCSNAILEEDDERSLKMKNNYRPMLGLYLATSNHSGEKVFDIGKQYKKEDFVFLSNPSPILDDNY